jgi:hypothetical protein
LRSAPFCCLLPVLRHAARLVLAIAVAAPAWAEEIRESEALSPGEVVDLATDALSKSGIRLYGEETASVLADFGPADASEFRTTLGLRAVAPLTDSFVLRTSAAELRSSLTTEFSEPEAELGSISSSGCTPSSSGWAPIA